MGLSWVTAALIGVIACPTDPVVASTIVTGELAERNLSERLRHTISAESGFNDGLVLPLVSLPILMLDHSWAEAVRRWAWDVVAWKVGFGAVLGFVTGRVAGALLSFFESRDAIRSHSLLGFTLALTLLTLGVAYLASTDDVLAVFIAGLAFDTSVTQRDRLREQRIQETVNQFFSIPIFALLGYMLPIDAWKELGWMAAICALTVLLIRRLPVVLLLRRLMPSIRSPADAAFAGWFGPIGVAAIFYSTDAVVRTGRHDIWNLTSLLIATSVLLHGVTASPLTRLYGRRQGGSGLASTEPSSNE